MKKNNFIIRMVGFIFFSVCLPILAINYKFPLFKKSEGDVSKFTGWGIISALIVVVVIEIILHYLIKSFSFKPTVVVRILKYLKSLGIPLVLICLLCKVASQNIDNIIFISTVCSFSFLASAIINPLPLWAYKKNMKDLREELNK